jgi:DNA-binding NarL/FixJ family response regulator
VSETATWSNGLDPDHTNTLANLVAGLTDQASAHRLGVSERTVQRRIRELMDSSASGNRMQLGHRAALAGLPHRHHPRPEPPTLHTPDAAAMRLLHLLLADVAADRTLNMSVSSVERRIRELMTLAGARSRAQLGWRATRWGWLPSGSHVAVVCV